MNKGDKVYVVRFGEYSDQGIAAVFSSEEEAEKYCYVQNNISENYLYDNHWVDEYILDECKIEGTPIIKRYYVATLEKETGDFFEDELSAGDERIEDCLYTKDVIVEETDFYIMVKSTKSYEHARKVAIEKYQIYTQNQLENGES